MVFGLISVCFLPRFSVLDYCVLFGVLSSVVFGVLFSIFRVYFGVFFVRSLVLDFRVGFGG